MTTQGAVMFPDLFSLLRSAREPRTDDLAGTALEAEPQGPRAGPRRGLEHDPRGDPVHARPPRRRHAHPEPRLAGLGIDRLDPLAITEERHAGDPRTAHR